MNEKQRKSVKSVAEGWQELQRLTALEGDYAYRGQKNAKWGVESGASWRLRSFGKLKEEGTIPEQEFVDYHKYKLLGPARMDGHGVEEGRKLSDLELLAKLQHYGAATCLIDFTRNFLAAMWFACRSHEEEGKEKNGKIFILNTRDSENFRPLNDDKELERDLESFLSREGKKATSSQEPSSIGTSNPSLWHWSPHGLLQWIITQDSLFIFGQPKIEDTLLKKQIEISHEHKGKIEKELKKLGIIERALFKDLPGFAVSHGRNKSFPWGYGTSKNHL